MDLSTPRLFQKVILPSSVPVMFTGIRLAGAVAILVLVAAEMIGAKAGLGYLINASQYNFAIPQMTRASSPISAIGVAFNQFLVDRGTPAQLLARPRPRLTRRPGLQAPIPAPLPLRGALVASKGIRHRNATLPTSPHLTPPKSHYPSPPERRNRA